MGDLLERAAAWLDDQRNKHLTRLVTYARGAASVEFQATVGKTVFQVDNGYGLLMRIESRDYLVRTDDLVLEGLPTFPKRGDKIREAQGEKLFVYEVLAPGHEPEWRYSDAYRRALRIHTKFVGTE